MKVKASMTTKCLVQGRNHNGGSNSDLPPYLRVNHMARTCDRVITCNLTFWREALEESCKHVRSF